MGVEVDVKYKDQIEVEVWPTGYDREYIIMKSKTFDNLTKKLNDKKVSVIITRNINKEDYCGFEK